MKKYDFDVTFKNNIINKKDLDILSDHVTNIRVNVDGNHHISSIIDFEECGKINQILKKLTGKLIINVYVFSKRSRTLSQSYEYDISKNNLCYSTNMSRTNSDENMITSVIFQNLKNII